MGSLGEIESAGGGSRSSTVACDISVRFGIGSSADYTYATVFVRPECFVLGALLAICLLAICGGCLRRHGCE